MRRGSLSSRSAQRHRLARRLRRSSAGAVDRPRRPRAFASRSAGASHRRGGAAPAARASARASSSPARCAAISLKPIALRAVREAPSSSARLDLRPHGAVEHRQARVGMRAASASRSITGRTASPGGAGRSTTAGRTPGAAPPPSSPARARGRSACGRWDAPRPPLAAPSRSCSAPAPSSASSRSSCSRSAGSGGGFRSSSVSAARR